MCFCTLETAPLCSFRIESCNKVNLQFRQNLHRTRDCASSIDLYELDNGTHLQFFSFNVACNSSSAILMDRRPVMPPSLYRNDFTENSSCIPSILMTADIAFSIRTFNFSQLMRTTLSQMWLDFDLFQSVMNIELGA